MPRILTRIVPDVLSPMLSSNLSSIAICFRALYHHTHTPRAYAHASRGPFLLQKSLIHGHPAVVRSSTSSSHVLLLFRCSVWSAAGYNRVVVVMQVSERKGRVYYRLAHVCREDLHRISQPPTSTIKYMYSKPQRPRTDDFIATCLFQPPPPSHFGL